VEGGAARWYSIWLLHLLEKGKRIALKVVDASLTAILVHSQHLCLQREREVPDTFKSLVLFSQLRTRKEQKDGQTHDEVLSSHSAIDEHTMERY